MNPRQETILKSIVDEYIRAAEPVGSRFLAEQAHLDVSPATIRNDMVELEREGYLRQPHTSAGRIPTEKAFVYYLQHFVEAKRETGDARSMRKAIDESDADLAMKMLAKTFANLSGEMAIVAFGNNSSYYTGVSNLFNKPEFHDLELIQTLSTMMDRFDDVAQQVFEALEQGTDAPRVMIGSENPFGAEMSTIVVKYRLPNQRMGIIGLVGPMRMDYSRNLGLLESAKGLLDDEDNSDV